MKSPVTAAITKNGGSHRNLSPAGHAILKHLTEIMCVITLTRFLTIVTVCSATMPSWES